MVDTMEIKKKRFDFLTKLYGEAGGSRSPAFRREQIGEKIGIGAVEANEIADYLANALLIDGDKDYIYLSFDGINEVESARKHPEEPTDHFPAANVTYVGTMISSQVMQGSPGAKQVMQTNVMTPEDRRTLDKVVTLLNEHMDELHLTSAQESDLRADVETIEAQTKSSRPKRTVIKESCGTIKEVLLTVATLSTVAPHVIQLLGTLHL